MVMKYMCIILGIISAFLLARSIFMFLFALDNYNMHKKRLRQLQFNDKKELTEDEINKGRIEAITRPVIRYIFPKLKIRNNEELFADLRLAGWDKFYTPIQFKAMRLTLFIAGCIVTPLLYMLTKSWLLSGIVFFGFAGMFTFLFNNSLTERKNKLFSEFPEFIRVVQGNLEAGEPFISSMEKAIEYVGDEWKPILTNFIVTCEVKSVATAIEELQDYVNIFEVKEFFSIIKLTLDQGIDAREAFERQTEKVEEMLLEVAMIKISKRQMYCIMLQGPLLLTLFVGFGLQTFSSLFSFI